MFCLLVSLVGFDGLIFMNFFFFVNSPWSKNQVIPFCEE